MKLHNFQVMNFRHVDGSVMRGQITMTQDEYKMVRDYLLFRLRRAITECDTSIRDGLWSYNTDTRERQTLYPFCLGVTATQLIVHEWNLPRYKNHNYQIIIKE